MEFHFRQILRLALPSIATFSSMTFTGMLTLVIIGRLGADSIAVVGISNILMYNLWALFAGLNEAVNYLVSQNYGEKTMRLGNLRLQLALVISLGMGLILFAMAFVMPHFVFVWLGVKAPLVALGGPYIKIRMFAFCFTLFSSVYYGYMRAVGDTRTPMYISLGTNALLVVLTYAWTYGALGLPRLGINGAALSMIVTEGLGLAASVIIYYGPYHKQFQTRQWLPMSMREMRFMMRESAKLSVMELSMSIGMLVFTACIARLGTVAIAANEITMNILSLGFMPANGFGAAATIVVGQEVGARRPERARNMGLQTVLLGFLFMVLFSVFLVLFARPVAHIYTGNANVVALTVVLLHIAAFIQVFDGSGIVLAGGLRGVGETTFLFRVSLILNWVVFVPLILLLTFGLHQGQVGAWIAFSLLLVLLCLANLWRYLRKDWNLAAVQTSTESHGVSAPAESSESPQHIEAQVPIVVRTDGVTEEASV